MSKEKEFKLDELIATVNLLSQKEGEIPFHNERLEALKAIKGIAQEEHTTKKRGNTLFAFQQNLLWFSLGFTSGASLIGYFQPNSPYLWILIGIAIGIVIIKLAAKIKK